MANRQGDVDLRFAQNSAPQLTLWLGLAWLGLTWLGLAWPGLAWPGLAWLGLAWSGLAWLGLARPGHNEIKKTSEKHSSFIV